MAEEELRQKATRLIKGEVVEVCGHSVAMGRERYIFDPCFCCSMDSLCHQGNDICELCGECDVLTHDDCFLILMDNNN